MIHGNIGVFLDVFILHRRKIRRNADLTTHVASFETGWTTSVCRASLTSVTSYIGFTPKVGCAGKSHSRALATYQFNIA